MGATDQAMTQRIESLLEKSRAEERRCADLAHGQSRGWEDKEPSVMRRLDELRDSLEPRLEPALAGAAFGDEDPPSTDPMSPEDEIAPSS